MGFNGGKNRYILGCLALWLIILLFLSFYKYSYRQNTGTDQSFVLAGAQITLLQQQNKELYKLLENLKLHTGQPATTTKAGYDISMILYLYALDAFLQKKDVGILETPEIFQEKYVRDLYRGLSYLYDFVNTHITDLNHTINSVSNPTSQLQNSNNKINHIQTFLKDTVKDLISHTLAIRDIEDSMWKLDLNKRISNLVRRRIEYIQNPANCSTAHKLICDVDKACGFGCQIHHLTYCLIMAYASGRTLLLSGTSWKYDSAGFEHEFQPLSLTCNEQMIAHNGVYQGPKKEFLDSEKENVVLRASWKDDNSFLTSSKDVPVIDLPIIDAIKSKFFPLAIPADLSALIEAFHGRPEVWWLSQFVAYILRPGPNLNQLVQKLRKGWRGRFDSPIVGVHVRRTDKIGTEANFHDITEYMNHVEHYFTLLDRKLAFNHTTTTNGPYLKTRVPRRVYLATDDVNVLHQAKTLYPSYTIIGNQNAAKSADTSQRYSLEGLIGVYLDVYFLSQTDYLVCTFSSQVCRLAYELMNARTDRYKDAGDNFYSLDDSYYFGGGRGLDTYLRRDYEPPMDISFAKNNDKTTEKNSDENPQSSPYFNALKALIYNNHNKVPSDGQMLALRRGTKFQAFGYEKNGYMYGKPIQQQPPEGVGEDVRAFVPSHLVEYIQRPESEFPSYYPQIKATW